jgi:polar amino acid transport system substrate-binding protein
MQERERRRMKGLHARLVTMALAIGVGIAPADAGPLLQRIEVGDSIRLGFANEVPWAYPGEHNEPKGFANAYTLAVLKKMGYDNIEPVVTDWAGLIPGLKANRFDIITGGMYIIASRCKNVAFSEPIGEFGDAFIVPKGNPKGIENYQDIKEKDAIFVTGAGYNTVEAARKEGVPDANVMQVPGPTEILAAVRSGRADAGGATYFTALNLASRGEGEVEVTSPGALPKWTKNWVGIAFRKEDQDFVDKFNAAQKDFPDTQEMWNAVEECGYSKSNLPGDVTAQWVCNNR